MNFSLWEAQYKAATVGAILGAALVLLAQYCWGCAPGPDLAAYSAEQAACVQRASSLAESQACRASSKAAWHVRWCAQGHTSYCEDGGAP